MSLLKQKGQSSEDLLLDALDSIRPDRDELINRRINHINFARTVFWLCVRSRSSEFIYSADLSEFIKTSHARSNQILSDLVRIGILIKKFPTSNLVEYWFHIENGAPVILNYFDRAKKTLGLKLTLK